MVHLKAAYKIWLDFYLTISKNYCIVFQTLAEAVRTASLIPQGFKDLVAKRCEEKGILFVPVLNKFYEAKQVYRLGSDGVQVYFDRNVIFYSQNNSSWLPISLNRLIDMV